MARKRSGKGNDQLQAGKKKSMPKNSTPSGPSVQKLRDKTAPPPEIPVPLFSQLVGAGRRDLVVTVNVPASDVTEMTRLLDEDKHNREKFKAVMSSEDKKKMKDCVKKGDEFLRKEMYDKAIKAYTEALGCDPHNLDVRCSRASAYLEAELFWQATADAGIVLKRDPRNSTASFIRGSSCIGVGKYSKALSVLERALNHPRVTNRKILENLAEESRLFVRQSETGEGYDDVYLGKTTQAAEFTRRVKIVEVGHKDFVLVANENIKAGQLILVTKALVVMKRSNDENDDSPGVVSEKESWYSPVFAFLEMYPEWRPLFNSLWAGRIYSQLDFKNPQHDGVLRKVSKERIMNIWSNNEFTTRMFSKKRPGINDDDLQPEDSYKLQSGLWYLPCFTKHSCWNGNAFWRVYGDLMFIRALKPIKPGEEIVMHKNALSALFNRANPKDQRERMKNPCECSLCKMDNSESKDVKCEKIKLLRNFSRGIGPSTKRNQEFILRLMKMSEKLDALSKFDVSTLKIYNVLAQQFAGKKSKDSEWDTKCRRVLLRGFELSYGTPFTQSALYFIVNAIKMFPKDAVPSHLLDKLERAHFLAYGTRQVYPELLAEVSKSSSIGIHILKFMTVPTALFLFYLLYILWVNNTVVVGK